jgi:hypothetical protein
LNFFCSKWRQFHEDGSNTNTEDEHLFMGIRNNQKARNSNKYKKGNKSKQLTHLPPLKTTRVPQKTDISYDDPVVRRERLRVGFVEQVKVMLIDSVDEFWIRRLADSSAYNSMMRKLNQSVGDAIDRNPIMSNIRIGDLVIHMKDSTWYRAEVIDLDEFPEEETQLASICYIDTGDKNLCMVKNEYFRPLDAQFLNYPAYAIRCHLANLKPFDASQGYLPIVTELFGHWARGKTLDMAVVDEIHENYYSVKLKSKTSGCQVTRSISGILIANKLARKVNELVDDGSDDDANDYYYEPNGGYGPNETLKYAPMKQLSVNETLSACMSSFESLNEFNMRMFEDKDTEDRFRQIGEDMNHEYFNQKNCDNMFYVPIVNHPCAAVSQTDSRWYRGKILKVHENLDMEILFVDYGNIELVKFVNIRKITPNYLRFTVYTFKCKLFGVSYENEENLNNANALVTSQIGAMSERTG